MEANNFTSIYRGLSCKLLDGKCLRFNKQWVSCRPSPPAVAIHLSACLARRQVHEIRLAGVLKHFDELIFFHALPSHRYTTPLTICFKYTYKLPLWPSCLTSFNVFGCLLYIFMNSVAWPFAFIKIIYRTSFGPYFPEGLAILGLNDQIFQFSFSVITKCISVHW
jgi:hypothetical protein